MELSHIIPLVLLLAGFFAIIIFTKMEKHNLLKMAGLTFLLTFMLTWIIPIGGMQQGGTFVVDEVSRMGISNVSMLTLQTVGFFVMTFTLLFLLGAFYQLLSKITAYQDLTSSIAKFWKKREIIFVLITAFIFTALAAVVTETLVLLIFVPFVVGIASKLKLSKITAFSITFGSILIGLLGSIYNRGLVGINVGQFSLEYSDYIWARLAILLVGFVVFNLFNVLHVRKTLKDKKSEAVEDPFVVEEVKKKEKFKPYHVFGIGVFFVIGLLLMLFSVINGFDYFVPILLILGLLVIAIALVAKLLPKALFGVVLTLFALIIIMAFLPWHDVFEITLFQEWAQAFFGFELTTTRIMDYTIISLFVLGILSLISLIVKTLSKASNKAAILSVLFSFIIITACYFIFGFTIPRVFDSSPIFSYILGDFGNAQNAAFGAWTLMTIQTFLLITIFIIKGLGRVKTDEFLTSIGEGMKKTAGIAGLVVVIYAVLVIAIIPLMQGGMATIPTIVDWIVSRTENFNIIFFNIILWFIAAMSAGVFSVEYPYIIELAGNYLITSNNDYIPQMTILLQSAFGFVSLFVPTSIILMIGLAYSKISYKEWLKYIWKFLIVMFIVIIIVLFVIF